MMRDEMQRSAGRALAHRDAVHQQIANSRAGIETGYQVRVAADDVLAPFDS